MRANTVFVILTAFVHNFYRHFLGLVAGVAFGLDTTSRVKHFVFSFISDPFKWVNCSSRMMLRLNMPNHACIKLQVWPDLLLGNSLSPHGEGERYAFFHINIGLKPKYWLCLSSMPYEIIPT